jgi:hypothetical protein
MVRLCGAKTQRGGGCERIPKRDVFGASATVARLAMSGPRAGSAPLSQPRLKGRAGRGVRARKPLPPFSCHIRILPVFSQKSCWDPSLDSLHL